MIFFSVPHFLIEVSQRLAEQQLNKIHTGEESMLG